MATVLDNPAAVRRVAMDLLARREHGRIELARKLSRRGAAAELIDSALDRLAEQGLLNEGRYIECFIRSRAYTGKGPQRIREELLQRGLPREAVEQALVSADINWAEQLRDVWQRKYAAVLPRDAREQAQQGRFLAYRGYSLDMIGRLLRGANLD